MANSMLTKKMKTSDALKEIVGVDEITRADMTRGVWAYIKSNELQDTNNKKVINPDEKLSRVLGTAPIDMFKMTGVLNKHLS